MEHQHEIASSVFVQYFLIYTVVAMLQALRDIRNFSSSFWLICAMLTTYYSFLTAYISNGGQVILATCNLLEKEHFSNF